MSDHLGSEQMENTFSGFVIHVNLSLKLLTNMNYKQKIHLLRTKAHRSKCCSTVTAGGYKVMSSILADQ